MIGRRLRQFELVEPIGSGAMGVVYKAWDHVLRRHVALKVLQPQPQMSAGLEPRTAIRDLLHEARAAARLDHPNIVAIYEVFETEGLGVLAMQLLEGPSLRARISRGPLSVSELDRYTRGLARGLAHAHGNDVLHRDIKPENLLLDPDSGLRIVDFGLAKRISGDETQTLALKGTFPYLPPERFDDAPFDARGDVFATGVVFHEMMTGSRPFEGDSLARMALSIQEDEPPDVRRLRPDIPPSLIEVTERMLSKDPADRFQSAVELLESLDSPKTTARGTERFLSRSKRRTLGSRRRRFGWLSLVLILLLGAVGVGLKQMGRGRESAPRYYLSGQIRDPSGKPLEGARVTVDGYPFEARASTDGLFHRLLPAVRAGDRVRVRVSHPRFRTHTRLVEIHPDSLHLIVSLRELP